MRILFGLFLIMQLLMLPVPLAAAAAGVPSWRPGDTLILKTVYRLQPDTDKWSDPVYWKWEAKEKILYQDEPAIKVNIDSESFGMNGMMIFRISDHSMRHIQLIKKKRGSNITREVSIPDQRPVASAELFNFSILPVDMPVFPLLKPSTRLITVKKEIDAGLNVKQVWQQRARLVEKMPAEIKSAMMPEKDIIHVICRFDQELLFEQYWCHDIPLPIYGETPKMKYWLERKANEKKE